MNVFGAQGPLLKWALCGWPCCWWPFGGMGGPFPKTQECCSQWVRTVLYTLTVHPNALHECRWVHPPPLTPSCALKSERHNTRQKIILALASNSCPESLCLFAFCQTKHSWHPITKVMICLMRPSIDQHSETGKRLFPEAYFCCFRGGAGIGSQILWTSYLASLVRIVIKASVAGDGYANKYAVLKHAQSPPWEQNHQYDDIIHNAEGWPPYGSYVSKYWPSSIKWKHEKTKWWTH